MATIKQRSYSITFIAFSLFAVLAVLFYGSLPRVSAQTYRITWGQPIRLSDPAFQTWPPAITSDKAGNVYAMWSQTTPETSIIGEGDTLYFMFWNGQQWSTPIDVLVTPGNQAAEYPDLAVTPDGWLHAIWGTGGLNSRLMYSRSPACCANNTRNWTEPVMIGSPINLTSAIVVDYAGNLNVVYPANDTGNIIFRRSLDSGITWSQPVEISSGKQKKDEYSAYPRLAVDLRGRIHVVWTIMPYPGRFVMYSRSDDGGKTWSVPYIVDKYDPNVYNELYGPILIDVETVGNDQVHLIWDGSPTVERHHKWSSNGGLSWNRESTLIPEVTGGGRALWNDMASDSSGNLHVVSLKQPWHAYWDGSKWSRSTAIGQTSYAEDLRITCTLGNQLHVVWLEVFAGENSIVWYVRGDTSAPVYTPAPLLRPSTPTPFFSKTLSTIMPTFTPSPSPTPLNLSGRTPRETNPAEAIFIAMGVVGAVILGLLGLVAMRKYLLHK